MLARFSIVTSLLSWLTSSKASAEINTSALRHVSGSTLLISQTLNHTCHIGEKAEIIKEEASHFTPVVTKDYIKKFITSDSPGNSEKITKALYSLRNTNPAIAQYIDFALTHLPGLKFALYTKEQIEKLRGKGTVASYLPLEKIIVISKEALSKPSKLMTALRHEIRHAAMNAAHRLLSNDPTTYDCFCNFPNDADNANQTSEFIKKGDNRKENLRKMLYKEKKGLPMTAAEKKTVKDLRSSSKTEYSTYYKTEHTERFSKEILRILGHNPIGKTINLDSYISDPDFPVLGTITIKSVTPTPDGNVKVSFTTDDPLCSAILSIRNHQYAIENYPPAHRDFEREAFLIGDVPFPIINYLYPELVKSTQKMLDKARSVAIKYSPVSHSYMPFDDFNAHSQILAAQDEVGFQPKFTESYLIMADWFIENGKIKEATKTLDIIVRKGAPEHLAEANLKLARLEHKAKNFKTAATLFKRADRRTPLSRSDRIFYAEALEGSNQFKSALKQTRKLNR